MIIESDYLTEGLFGQIFVWMLEVLPYVHSRGWRPEWRIRSKNYGQPPYFNIFPGIIQTTYQPDDEKGVVRFEELERRNKFNFRHDFGKARDYWRSYFCFTQDVYDRAERYWTDNMSGKTVLGIHYRGTDKNTDFWQSNPVSRYQFLSIVEDFLSMHPDITAIFIASDDANFVEAIGKVLPIHYHEQPRSRGRMPTWNSHDVDQNVAIAKAAILDCLTLSRCRYVLKCMSQLSAFSKVFNPDLEIYRVSAFKLGWFPEAYIPLYRSKNKAIQALLDVLQRDDYRASLGRKILGFHRRLMRIAVKGWKERAAIGAEIQRRLFRVNN